MNKIFSIAILILSFVLVGCSSAPPTFKTGEDANISFDGLTQMDGTIMDAVWAREDIDLTSYSKVMFEGVGVEYRDVSGPYSGRGGTRTASSARSTGSEFKLDAETKAFFEEEIGKAFKEEVAKSEVFTIVGEPGPDVLLVRGGLTDVVSNVPPDTMGRSRIFLDSVGEATLVLEIRSSQSNAIYVRAIDRRAAESHTMTESTTVTNALEVRRLGRAWGNQLRNGLDTLLTDGLAN